MVDDSTPVRILVARPAASRADSPSLVEALSRLGAAVRIEVVTDAAACLAAARAANPDLVVVDRELPDHGAILDAHRGVGPPVVMVTGAADEAAVLEAFRRGAADCVARTDELETLLPVVALEQIQSWRQQREQGARERRIQDLERFNAEVVRTMSGGLLVVDVTGRVRFANPGAERMLARSAALLRRTSVLDLFEAPAREALASALGSGEGIQGLEVNLRRGDASLPAAVFAAALRDGDGRRTGSVLILQDLTEMKQLQRQVLQAEKLASIGQLAAGVAHEINNPMGFIHANLAQMAEYVEDLRRVFGELADLRKAVADGSAEGLRRAVLALEDVVRELDAHALVEDLANAIRESQEGSERIRHIVQDLRAFAHQDTGERVPADVNRCLDSTAHIVWTMMKHSVALRKDYGELPPVHGFPMQLQQVFMNLLVNAYQAIEARPPDDPRPAEISLRTRSRDDGVVVRIADTGVGIPRDVIDRIFDPFFTTKEVGVGMGLGLATSYNLVRRHGGRVRVESEPGVGTTFEVWLPLRGAGVGA